MKSMSQVATTAPIVISVDYSCSLEQMIAAGKYDWTNYNITAKRFPVLGEGVVEFEAKLFKFDGSTSSEDAVEATKKADPAHPWEPAKIEHLFVFGEQFHEEQRQYPIVALGSVGLVNGDRYVPYLVGLGVERRLYLGWWGGDWGSFFRFLAVRTVSRPSAS